MLGEKYSNSDYQIYKETGNLNHFEEVIDLMMIDELRVKYKLTDDVIESIKGLDSTAKRNAILSLLDQEYSLYTKIAELSGFVYDESIGKIIDLKKNQVNKLEYIKQIILMLREYVKVGSVEKDKFGEVMTPLNVIKDMLAVLPEEVWSNPNLKWLDPANGTGPFPSLVIYKLMRGLEEWEPNPDKRYKHIIENMIYVCELQPKNMFLWLCTIDYRDEYDCNIYTGSFLDDGFDKHMKEVWEVDKFDVILGNPPYNDTRMFNNLSIDIYPKFINKAFILSNHVILMIVKSNWMSKPTMRKFRESMIKTLSVNEIKHYDVNPFINTDIQGGVSHFLINKNINSDKFILNGVSYVRDMDLDFLPYELNSNELMLLSKFRSFDKLNLDNLRSPSYYKIGTNDKRLSTCTDNSYKCHVSIQKGSIKYLPFMYSNERIDNDIDKYKIFTPSAYGKPHNMGRVFKGHMEICSASLINWVFDSEYERDQFYDYINSKVFRYAVSIVKNKKHVYKNVFSLVPNINFNELNSIDDANIYKYLNLTTDDIKTIEDRCEKFNLLK